MRVESSGIQFSSIQSLSHVQLFVTPWTVAHHASLSITNSQSLPIESVMPSNLLILCCPLLLLPSIFPSIRVLSNELALCIRWSDYWSFNFSISPSNEYSGLISLLSEELSRIFSSNTIWKYQFFSAQSSLWSDSHICTWLLEKNIALTIWTFVSKMMSLLFNTLPRFVTGFLPRSQHFFFFKFHGCSYYPQWFWSPGK